VSLVEYCKSKQVSNNQPHSYLLFTTLLISRFRPNSIGTQQACMTSTS
jgi:hypothetical protein